jgi:hypothetical protein
VTRRAQGKHRVGSDGRRRQPQRFPRTVTVWPRQPFDARCTNYVI